MTATRVEGIEGLRSIQGETIGPSDWREVSQAQIDSFAELSGDDQWIHVDAERAQAESPFGTTIAHGNLTLSMIDGFRLSLLDARGFKLAVNYGWNRVRFPAPVPAGSRLRCSAEITEIDELADGWYQLTTRFTVEIEGGDKPVCVADAVGRVLAE